MAQEMNQEKGGGGSSESDPNPCPICLGILTRDAYLDRCFHRYCYQCILRWTEVVSSRSSSSSRKPNFVKCPLCKTENFSIIYGYDGSAFQRHFINQTNNDSTFFTNAHKYRLQCYYTEPRHLSESFNVGRYWKTRKHLQSNNRLEKWLMRELQALIQEDDVGIIMHHIIGVIESFSKRCEPKGSKYTPEQKQAEFRAMVGDASRPFLTARTERFVDEVELFLASGLTVEAYDEAYKRCLGWKKPEEGPGDAEVDASEHEQVTPYLHFFDEDDDNGGGGDFEEEHWGEDIHEEV